MDIPILAGIYVDGSPDVRVAYPVNLVPVAGQDGTADRYLRPAEGILPFATGQGFDRGGIVIPAGSAGNAGGFHYRVSGTKLITVSSTGVVAVLGDVGGSGPARMDFSTDRLGVLSGGLLYYWDGTTLTHVTDPNIPANLIDMVWVDGYWMVTDGVNVAVSNLADVTVFNPLKFTQTNRPDPVKALIKVRNEVHVISRHFIDVLQNIGGQFFPFQILTTAVVTRGAVGTRAACVYNDTAAFVGGGNSGGVEEAPGVHLAQSAQTLKISTREIDNLLLSYTTAQLAAITMQPVVNRGSQFLFINLPDRTVVYDAIASADLQRPVWHVLTGAITGFSQYRAVNITRASDQWIVGDPLSTAIGVWSTTDSSHWGSPVRWEFSTPILRNGGKGAILHQLELLSLTGVVASGLDPRISTASSTDGVTFGQEKSLRSGKTGDRTKRLVWFQLGSWRNYRIQRFSGDSGSRLSPMNLDAEIEALTV